MEVPGEATRGASSPGTGVNGKCELPREVLETRLGPFASAASDVTAESSFVYLTQTRVTWEEGTSSQEMLPNGWLWGMYVLLIIHVGGASPWAGGLGGVKEQAELAMRSEAACSAPPWPLLTEDTRHSLFLALPVFPLSSTVSNVCFHTNTHFNLLSNEEISSRTLERLWDTGHSSLRMGEAN